jgi:cysteinyl-tRNA synthetase
LPINLDLGSNFPTPNFAMSLNIYNTLSRTKELFQTLTPNQVKMYCCGVTVYDYCHLGHARSSIVWDTVRRYLQWRGYQVEYVQNFTDIDDKILNRAELEQSSMTEVAEKYTAAYFEDMHSLNVCDADHYPLATKHIQEIQDLITDLEQKGFAYAVEGDVYFRVRKFDEYGKLSKRNLDALRAGAGDRVEAADPDQIKKEDPFDFALWKAAKPGEPAWESPWGNGRPGWHIECSAMIRKQLGETIDIHCGGNDLVFPHHENEIAQSECAHDRPLSTYWMHNGMVNIGGEKMSKSLGNFTTIRKLLNDYRDANGTNVEIDPMTVRLFVLTAQYRKPIDFNDASITAAGQSWQTIKDGLLFGYEYGEKLGWGSIDPVSATPISTTSEELDRFRSAVDDDFNFAEGLVVIFELAKELRKVGNIIAHDSEQTVDPILLKDKWQTLIELAGVLGLVVNPDQVKVPTSGLSDAEIEALLVERQTARANKDFATSDRIRAQLTEDKIVVIDKAGVPSTWYRG